MVHEPFTFIAAINSRKILVENLLRSPELGPDSAHQLLTKKGYVSASLAYNAAIPEADNDLLIFIHQDVYLPAGWCDDVSRWIQELDNADTPWGVLGCFGTGRGKAGGLGRVYSNGWGLQGAEIFRPEPVETLDEIVLITRRSFGLRFDSSLPHFHMYGVDLCLLARDRGRRVYAIPAFCVHNTNQLLSLPDEFYECYWYIKKKWRRYLPVRTSCIEISRFDLDLRERKLRHLVDRLLGSPRKPIPRVDDPRTLLTTRVGNS